MFDVQKAVKVLAKADPQLGRLMAQVGPYRVRAAADFCVFTELADAIASQQLSGKAAATIFGRVKALYGSPERLEPEQVLQTPDDTLRQAGLSWAKVAAIKDLAHKTLVGVVPPASQLAGLDDAEIVRRLTQVRGVGPWTAEMLLMFQLGRPDVLPVADLGVRKGYQRWYGLADVPTPKAMTALGEAWRPYRSVGSWYMWRVLEL